QDPAALATLDVLTLLGNPAIYTDSNLYALVICKAVNISLERGNSDASPPHYVSLGIIASDRFGDCDAGYRFAKMACDLTERRGLWRFGARTYLPFGMVMPWTRPFREAIEPVRRTFRIGNEQGDLTFAAYACNILVSTLWASGHPLDEIEREGRHG